MFRFFLIWYVGRRSAHPVIHGAWNGPSGCVWYDEWPTKLPAENIISLEGCDMQLFNHRSYIFVTSVYQSKQPVQWSPVHQMDHLAVCDMISGPLSFLWSILYHWKAVIYSCPTVYIIYLLHPYKSQSGPSSDLRCFEWTIWLFVIWWVAHQVS